MNFIAKVAFFVFLLCCFRAEAQEPAKGLWCDTPEQVSRFIELSRDPQAALITVNTEADKKDACILGYIVMFRGKKHGVVRDHEGLWEITEILVVAVGTPHGFMQIVPRVYFTAFKAEEV